MVIDITNHMIDPILEDMMIMTITEAPHIVNTLTMIVILEDIQREIDIIDTVLLIIAPLMMIATITIMEAPHTVEINRS